MDNLILIVLISAGIALLSAIYFFWSVVKRKVENKELAEIAGLIQEGSYAFTCGLLFGLAAWTRMEFFLYDLVPVFLTVYVYLTG